MPMLAFMPWLRLRVPVSAAGISAFPLVAGSEVPQPSEVDAETVRAVLAQYMVAPQRALHSATVLMLEGKPFGADFNEEERDRLFEFGKHLAVAGMAPRRFDGSIVDHYTATGHYQVIVQAFRAPFTGSTSMSHRRKDGGTNVTYGATDVRFWIPDYLVSQGEPQLDLRLFEALGNLRALRADLGGEIEAACTQYLLANSDSPDVSLDVLSIATYAALERISSSSHQLGHVQARLAKLLSVVDASPFAGRLRPYFAPQMPAPAGKVLKEWIQALYVLRSALAHGKVVPSVGRWSQHEHLLVGAFIFPLTLKCLLQREGLYNLSDDDVAAVLGLEGLLASAPFFATAPAGYENELERRERSGWLRQLEVIAEARLELYLQQSAERAYHEITSRSGEDAD
jgi:hypothetical protein